MTIYRRGDIVTIQAVVATDFKPDREPDNPLYNQLAVTPIGSYQNFYVAADKATMVQPCFKPQDFVATVEGDAQGQVIATFDDQVWVRFDDGELQTWPAVALKHWRREDGVAAD